MSSNDVKNAYARAMQEHHHHAAPASLRVIPLAYSDSAAKEPDSRFHASSEGNKTHMEPLSDKEMARLSMYVRGKTDFTEAACKAYRMEDNEASVILAEADGIRRGGYEMEPGFYPAIGQGHLYDPYAERRVNRPLEGPDYLNPMVDLTLSSDQDQAHSEGQLPEELTRDRRAVGRGNISRSSNTEALSSGTRKPSTPSRPYRRTTSGSLSSPSSHPPSDPSTSSPRRSSRIRVASSKLALSNMADLDAQQSNQAPTGAGRYPCSWRQRYGGTCMHSFDTVQTHDRHVLTHIPDEYGDEVCNYMCLLCGNEFPRDDSCKRHLRDTHNERDIEMYCEELDREWWWPVYLFYSPKYKDPARIRPAPHHNTLSREQWMDDIVARYPAVVDKPHRYPKIDDDSWKEEWRNSRREAKRK